MFLHGGQCNGNSGNLCRLRAARVAIVGARGSRNEDAAGSVDQRLGARGAGGDVCRADVCGAPHMVVHVALLV